MRCSTRRCKGDPEASGGTIDPPRCPRCYKRHQRNQAPRAESTRPGNRTAQLPPIRVDPELEARIAASATSEGLTVTEWVRAICDRAAK